MRVNYCGETKKVYEELRRFLFGRQQIPGNLTFEELTAEQQVFARAFGWGNELPADPALAANLVAELREHHCQVLHETSAVPRDVSAP